MLRPGFSGSDAAGSNEERELHDGLCEAHARSAARKQSRRCRRKVRIVVAARRTGWHCALSQTRTNLRCGTAVFCGLPARDPAVGTRTRGEKGGCDGNVSNCVVTHGHDPGVRSLALSGRDPARARSGAEGPLGGARRALARNQESEGPTPSGGGARFTILEKRSRNSWSGCAPKRGSPFSPNAWPISTQSSPVR